MCIYPPDQRSDFIPIDFRSQKPHLGLALSLGNVDIPGARLWAGIAIPTVSPRFEDILEVKRRVLRPKCAKKRYGHYPVGG
jgi:hypothetical protein